MFSSSNPSVGYSASIRWIQDLGSKGKKDRFLLPDASGNGYDALLTNDSAQLDSAEESRPEATASAEGAGVLRDESEPR